MIQIKEIKYLENLNDLKDVVIQVSWEYSQDGFEAIDGTLQLPQPDQKTFIPIEQVTQELAIDWVRQFVDPESRQLQQIQSKPEIKTITF